MNALDSHFARIAFARSNQRFVWIAAIAVALAWLSAVAVTAQGAVPRTGVELAPYYGVWRRVAVVVPGSAAWEAGLRPGQIVRHYYTPPNRVILAAFESEKGVAVFGNRLKIVTRRWSPGADLLLLALGLSSAAVAVLQAARTSRPGLAIPLFALGAAAAAQLLLVSCLQADPERAYPASWVLANVLAIGIASLAIDLSARRWRSVRLTLRGALVVLIVAYAFAMTLRYSAFDSVDQFALAFRLVCAAVSLAAVLGPGANPVVSRRSRFAVGVLSAILVFPALAEALRVSATMPSLHHPVLLSALWALVPLAVAVLSSGAPVKDDSRAPARALSPWPSTEAHRSPGRHASNSPTPRGDSGGTRSDGRPIVGDASARDLMEEDLAISAPVELDGVIAEALDRLRSVGCVDADVRIGEMPTVWIDRSRLLPRITEVMERALAAAGPWARPRLRVWTERRPAFVRVRIVAIRATTAAGSGDPRPSIAGSEEWEAGATGGGAASARRDAVAQFWVDVPVVATESSSF